MQKQRSIKVEILSFVMALIVVWRHSALPLTEGMPSCFAYGFILSQSVNSALSMFMFVSAFLLFRKFEPQQYLEKLRSRGNSLLLPYLIWNVATMIVIYILTHTLGNECLPDHYTFNSIPVVVGNLILSRYTILWFLLDLFVFVLLSPILHLLVRDKRVGVIFLAIFTCLTMFVHNPHFSPINWLPYYFLGALIGKHYNNYLFKEQPFVLTSIAVPVWIALYTLTYFYAQTYCDVPTRLVAPFCFCGIYDLLNRIFHFRSHKIYSYSFFIYALHYIPLCFGRQIVLQNIATPYAWHTAYWCVPLLTILLSILVAYTLQRTSPNIYTRLSGGR